MNYTSNKLNSKENQHLQSQLNEISRFMKNYKSNMDSDKSLSKKMNEQESKINQILKMCSLTQDVTDSQVFAFEFYLK